MTKNVATDGPFTASAQIWLVNDDGTLAQVDYNFPPGIVPTQESFEKAIAESLKEVSNLEGGFRLLTRHEFVNRLLPGNEDFAIGGPDEFALDLNVKVH